MDKICRTLYRLPKVNLTNNIRLAAASSTQINLIVRQYSSKPPTNINQSISQKPAAMTEILEREIQDESAELNQHLSTDQFPGFSVETDDSDVKLTKQIGNATVTVRFTVSSSLSEWPSSEDQEMDLVSMPEFQVQITKNQHTLELSCFFEEVDPEDQAANRDPTFVIDELVIYEGEPKETEFAVNAEFFQDDLQASFMQYLADHGIDDVFAKNLVAFATSYEKKQYINLMKRLKNFVS